MLVSEVQLKKLVLEAGLVTEDVWNAVVENARRRRRDIDEVLVERGFVGQQTLSERLSQSLGVPYVNLRSRKIDPEIFQRLPEKALVELKAVPFGMADGKTLEVAFLDPQDRAAVAEVRKLAGTKVKTYLTDRKSYLYALHLYQRDLAHELRHLLESQTTVEGASKEYPVIKIVDTILSYAVASKASDVHLEPLADALLIRFRVDGILHDVMELTRDLIDPVTARIKILAGLKIDEHRVPQDGRLSFMADDDSVSVRVSVVPGFFGEKSVLRILNEHEQHFNLGELGLADRNLLQIQSALRRPRGLLLAVGPTGSGKTTTLYTLLNMLNTESVNISTIEDPVEYALPRVNQTQVNTQVGYTFATGLRSLLRQDPNVIMVGEIRDDETADIAVQSGLTGHMVLSTLHTKDAVGTVPRLLDMGVKPLVLASTLSLVVAQRLVRKICGDCKASYRLKPEEVESLSKDFQTGAMMAALKKAGMLDEQAKALHDLTLYRGKGCDRCFHTGYAGRVGVYEVMPITDALRQEIIEAVPDARLLETARAEGMLTLAEDGWAKVLTGATTLEEFLRVISE